MNIDWCHECDNPTTGCKCEAMTDTARLRALAEKATKGPRKFEPHDIGEWAGNVTIYLPRASGQLQQIITLTCNRKTANAEADGRLMAACDPQTIIALIDRAEKAERELAEARERVAQWMIRHSYATGHGDSVADLLGELTWQHKEREERLAEAKAQARTWQPIETIPDDIRGEVDLLVNGERRTDCWFNSKDCHWYDEKYNRLSRKLITHWMHRPRSPSPSPGQNTCTAPEAGGG